jgi:hypothetical protein
MIIEYKNALVKCPDVANQKVVGRINHKTVQMAFFQVTRNATWIGNRVLALESYPIATLQFPANRKLFRFEVGDLFIPVYEPYDLSNKVFTILRIEEESPESETINILAIEDVHYLSKEVATFTPSSGTGTKNEVEVLPFVYVDSMEAPYWLSPDAIKVITMANREGKVETGYMIFFSLDGTSYFQIGLVSSFTPYGVLYGNYPSTIMVDDQTGFQIILEPQDAVALQTISRAELFAGRNMALLGDELICFQTITPVETSIYQLTGIVRGMYDTERKDHLNGEPFWFFGTSRFGLAESSYLQVGATRYLKYVPYNYLKAGELDEAIAVPHEVTGRALKYLRPSNFFANGARRRPVYTGDIILTWVPRHRDRGAGMGLPTVVTDANPASDFEGLFRVEVYVSDLLVRTADDINALTWTYTEAMSITDNGSLPATVSFKLFAKRLDGSNYLLSAPAEVQVFKE